MGSNFNRLYHLDFIRFFAALYVVFYHYGFRGYNKDDMSLIQFQDIEFFSKYGYLGVDLFFIISGFVILMSAINSNIIDFIISRISRLYPAYWVCLILTTLVVVFFGADRYNVTPYVFFTNLTMLNGFFNIEYVDGVYWSLLVELKFYIIIGVILITKKTKYIMYIIYTWLAISTYFLFAFQNEWNILLSIINFFLIPKWCSYFVAGMLFFLIKKDGKFKKRIIPLILCFGLSLGYANIKLNVLNDNFNNVFSFYVVYAIICSFYFIFLLISLNKLTILNKPVFFRFGILTYPLYLLHQNIGYIIFNNLKGNINKYLLLTILLLIIIYFSYLLSIKLEKPIRIFIKNKLEQSSLKIKLLFDIK